MNNLAFQTVLRDLRAAHPAITFVGYFRTPKAGCCIKLDAAGHGGRALTAIITEARVAAHTGSELIEPEWSSENDYPARRKRHGWARGFTGGHPARLGACEGYLAGLLGGTA